MREPHSVKTGEVIKVTVKSPGGDIVEYWTKDGIFLAAIDEATGCKIEREQGEQLQCSQNFFEKR